MRGRGRRAVTYDGTHTRRNIGHYPASAKGADNPLAQEDWPFSVQEWDELVNRDIKAAQEFLRSLK